MTYRELLYKATRLIDKGEITLGEYEEMTKPLDRDVEQEPLEVEATKLQKAYNKGFEDCRQAVLDIWHATYSDNREENEEIQYKKIAFELPSVRPQESKTDVLDKIRDEIQKLRGCSCGCSDGIIDDIEDIIDKYREEQE